MQVILLERVERLGQMGQIVTVKPGFARNYLLPKKKALRASKDNLALFESQRAVLEAMNLERRSEAEGVAKSMGEVTVAIIRQAGEAGQLYGSVTARDVSDALEAADVHVGRSQIVLDKPIKTLGLFPVRVVLHPEVSVNVTVNVARSQDEAQLQVERGAMLTGEDARRARGDEDIEFVLPEVDEDEDLANTEA